MREASPIRRSRRSSALVCLLVLAAACDDQLVAVAEGNVECVLDNDCKEGICVDGACVAQPPDAGPPPVEDAGPPDAGTEDAGFPDAGPPDAGFPDAGFMDAGPEDAGFFDAGPPPEPQVLRVTSRPETSDALADCFCASQVTTANVDLALRAASGGQCSKPADFVDCGLTDPGCACVGAGLGTASWSSDGPAVEYRPMESMIVNEEVVRESGPDDQLTVRATLIDDCIASPNSSSDSVMFGCYLLDCRNMGGEEFTGPNDCLNYLDYDLNTCPNAIYNYLALHPSSEDCVARGPAAVRITVEVLGDGGFLRQFCTVMMRDQVVDAVQVASTNNRYEVVSVSPAVTEVTPGTVCPQAQ